MTELLTQSLAQIVTENHKTASVFEKYHLDFCCKGKRTLKEACVENKVNPADVLMDLESTIENKTDDTLDPTEISLTQLVDYIVQTHHSYVHRELPLIHGYLQKVSSKHGERHPELYKILELFTAIKEEMEMHIRKEEALLFPRICEVEKLVGQNALTQLNMSFITAPVSAMEQEHEHAGSVMEEIRKLTENFTPPTGACTTYKLSFAALQNFEKDLHQHVHLENNILFPGVTTLIKQLLN
ncbi:MAG TPA: iron-sulfur cluster repair di-iron protein [Chitinophagaceae bacterium]|nr:iron-sulfur cluster repair di-iron protein [Chitinophagaceae bacterium]